MATMPPRREALILGVAAVAAAAAGNLVGPRLLGHSRGQSTVLYAASFPDLSGRTRHLSEWKGQILVVNFWATWCAPCREEIPLLIAARQKYGYKGVEIVGIAIDNASKVAEFAANYKIPYPILLAEANGLDLMRELGNRAGGLPYTVFLDPEGNVAERKLGALSAVAIPKILDAMASGG